MKKPLSFLPALLLALTLIPGPPTAAEELPSVLVDGEPIRWSDALPFVDDVGRVMVPLRAVAEAMDLAVAWDAASGTATFYHGTKGIQFRVGQDTALYDFGKALEMDVAPVIRDGRVYAPIRYLAEYFDYSVTWSSRYNQVALRRNPETVNPGPPPAYTTEPEEPEIPEGAILHAESIQLSDSTIILYAGDTLTLSANILPRGAMEQRVFFSSADEKIATVNENGLVRAKRKGRTDIIAKTFNDVTAYCTVIVRGYDDLRYSTRYIYDDYGLYRYYDQFDRVYYDAASDRYYYYDDLYGRYYYYDRDYDRFVYLEDYYYGDFYDRSDRINAVAISLDTTAVTLYPGETYRIGAELVPYFADEKLYYTSAGNTIASVSSTGLVTAHSRGGTTIRIRSSSGLEASFYVTVVPAGH